MNILLKRIKQVGSATIGDLYINGQYFCNTLEDVERDFKIKGETAIPKGSYKITFYNSPKFKRFLPCLLNVPNFDHILIHSGNTEHDTEGCILVGLHNGNGIITESRNTFRKLFALMEVEKDINITIE